MDQATDRLPRVQSVDRAMRLLAAVASAASGDCTAARLAKACSVDRATAWRILHTLEAHDMVSCNRETGQWSIGVSLVVMARSAGAESLIDLARPCLVGLSALAGETAALAVCGATTP